MRRARALREFHSSVARKETFASFATLFYASSFSPHASGTQIVKNWRISLRRNFTQIIKKTVCTIVTVFLKSHFYINRTYVNFLLKALCLGAQAIHEKIITTYLVPEHREFCDIPIGAQISALGPVRFARAKPGDETGGQRWIVDQIGMNLFRHVPPEFGRNAAGMEGKALDTVFPLIFIFVRLGKAGSHSSGKLSKVSGFGPAAIRSG